ncbi:hypothetical protein [Photorhabdus luminescens]|uniref:Uncharacterized protein n=1 Tax=Photorhabdus luminescens subsp. mexicana TaxID=2100167 RepID=A0A4R4JD70_PHOLU|nr:hypothetical protein [Photorhabdus luminescens]TDB51586.1 hypothetical protein C5468_11450 [Photorhabdus luminescens subsp. mexicana]
MRRLGYLLLSVGIIWILVAFNMETNILSQYSNKFNNTEPISSQQNHILIGAFITLYGLIMIISSKNQRLLESIYRSNTKEIAGFNSEEVFIPMQNSDYLKRANNYRHYDFTDKYSNTLEKRVVEFCKLCSSYIEEVNHNGGDKEAAKRKVISMIDTISSHLKERQSKEFKKLCEFHIHL